MAFRAGLVDVVNTVVGFWGRDAEGDGLAAVDGVGEVGGGEGVGGVVVEDAGGAEAGAGEVVRAAGDGEEGGGGDGGEEGGPGG